MLLRAVIGTAAAWLVERTTLPGRRVWRVPLVAPLAVPAFVNSSSGSRRSRARGLGRGGLVTTLSYFPFVYLPVAAVLRGWTRPWRKAARLGLGPWRTFARVVLAQVRPAVSAVCCSWPCTCWPSSGRYEMLRFPTFTTAILDQFESPSTTGPASVLGMVLWPAAVRCSGGDARPRRGSGTRGSAPGAARRPLPARLGRATPLALAGVGSLAVLALGSRPGPSGLAAVGTGQALEPTNLLPHPVGHVGLG